MVMRRGNVKNMGDIKDFNCTYDNSAGIRSEVTEGLGLTFPDAYTHCDTMVTLSKMLKEKDKAVICELPFCHTLEAEAMGGIINLGNEIAGPRAGGYVCTDVEEILNLPDMDFTKGRIQETLLACKKLREEGEHVVFEVAGPFTILNVLIDARYVFKGMRKKPEVMEKVFWKLGDQILKYMELVKEYGGDLISYADSSGGVNILGPKILGNSTGLSAFWVVTSILLGGGLFGFVGMVMVVPTFAVIYYIVDMILDNKLKKKKLPVRSDSYDEWSYVDSSGEYIHSEEIKSKAEEK